MDKAIDTGKFNYVEDLMNQLITPVVPETDTVAVVTTEAEENPMTLNDLIGTLRNLLTRRENAAANQSRFRFGNNSEGALLARHANRSDVGSNLGNIEP
jgi:hypothetical protein